MGDLIVCKEKYGTSSFQREYVKSGNGKILVLDKSEKFTSVTQFFRSVFLPQGYPESVSSDYLEYQLWDTLQAFASSMTMTLSTQALMKGVGVGDESATALAATITWILKDGTGMIGRIVFAWWKGTSLDCDAKRWRLFADILNDCAFCLELLSPMFPGYFTAIVCVAGVAKSLVGVAGGATRAALTQHQARRNNMADVSAKDGSQETLVNLAALICGLIMIPVVSGNQSLVWFLFFMFTALHLIANYCAVKAVCMETLNQARLHLLVQHFLTTSGEILSVDRANAKEPVLWSTRRQMTIDLGASMTDVATSHEKFKQLKNLYSKNKYILDIDLKSGKIIIVLHEDFTVEDQIRSCFQAEVLNYVIETSAKQSNVQTDQLSEMSKLASSGEATDLVSQSLQYTDEVYPGFCKELEDKGWITSHVLFGANEWRAEW